MSCQTLLNSLKVRTLRLVLMAIVMTIVGLVAAKSGFVEEYEFLELTLLALALSYPLFSVFAYFYPSNDRLIGLAFSLCGGGHARRAEILLPILEEYAKVVCFASGRANTRKKDLQEVRIDWEYTGVTWVYHNNDVSLLRSIFCLRNALLVVDVPRLIWEIYWRRYRIVFIDLDAVMTWAARLNNIAAVLLPILGFQRVYTVAFGHQASFKNMNIPAPPGTTRLKRWLIRLMFLAVSPCGAYCGFHFGSYGDEHTFLAPIAPEIIKTKRKAGKHITVYFSGLKKKDLAWLLRELRSLPNAYFEVFSPLVARSRAMGNVIVHPKSSSGFSRSLSRCRGLLTSAGYMAPSEALYLGIPLCVIPQWTQFEQWWNAAGIEYCGQTVIWKPLREASSQIKEWVNRGLVPQVKKVTGYENDGQRMRKLIVRYLQEVGIS